MKIEVKDVTKKYGRKKALDKLSFSLNGNKIYGLLGRNGAGKTTFMEILAGHMTQSEGELFVNGETPFNNRQVTEQICLIKEADNFHKDLCIKDILKTYSIFYPNWDEQLAKDLVTQYNLNEKSRIKTLSKGMASAVGIIVGLASKAPITIFDEPYIGLDAAARKAFYDILLEQYEREERMIIFSTHLIDEVSLLFEEVLILQEGKLLLQENAETLRESASVVVGPSNEVEAFIQDKQVMKTEKLAGMMTAYVFAPQEEARKAGLNVEGMPIQDLMIYLTEEGRSL